MTKRMLVDATHPEETRVAIVSDRRLEDFDFESASKKQLKGNIYLAKVVRIEPSLQAAFVEYGGNRHGFLPFSEIHPDYFRIPVADRPHDEESAEDDEIETSEEGEDGIESVAEEMVSSSSEGSTDTVKEEELDASEEEQALPEEPSEVVSAEKAESFVPTEAAHDVSALGTAPDAELGLITDFGNAAIEPVFTPAPVETVGGKGGEEELDERPRRPRMPRYKIQEVIKRRQIMLIQVVKEERGNKGAALTTYLSLAGRYCVLMPNTDRGGGVSRKITSHQDRRRMKEILDQLETPEGMAVILRTAGMEREPAEIQRDLEHLLRLWNTIREQTLVSTAPALIYEEANLIKRSIRDLYAADVEEILVAGQKGYDLAHDFMHSIMPEAQDKVKLYTDPVPLFFRYNVEKQIDQLYNPIVQLKSGGYIVINPTEALVSIDVNSGRATRERHIEETALKTNLEAADEIARQLRLRDLAGLVVIDFIDMEDGRNNAAVERRMKEAMRSDRARLQIGRLSLFGLMELSRQRLHPSLTEMNFERCPHCAGVGLVRTVDSAAISVLRQIEEDALRQPGGTMVIQVASRVALYILNQKRADLRDIEIRYNLQVYLRSDDSLVPPECTIERAKSSADGDMPAVDTDQVLAETAEEIAQDESLNLPSTRPASESGNVRRSRRRSNRGRRPRNAPQGEPNGNLQEGGDALPEDNIGNIAETVPQEGVGEGSDSGSLEARRSSNRRRGRRGGRNRRGRSTGQSSPDYGSHAGGEAFVAAPSSVPTSIHELDTTPRDPRDEATQKASSSEPAVVKPADFAPPPSPYEVTNPVSDSDKPKGGWWRKITG
ncbi:MAG: ribonuclease E/G [Alphaproteobacteria bacterium]|nr:ribonuclease E/G [Alphaproteobacteria bacterium]